MFSGEELIWLVQIQIQKHFFLNLPLTIFLKIENKTSIRFRISTSIQFFSFLSMQRANDFKRNLKNTLFW